jgi:hypothetical protein
MLFLPFILLIPITHSHAHSQSTSPDPDPELIPDRAKINGLGSGPHSDDDDTQKNLPIAGESNGDTEYFEVCVEAGTTCVVLSWLLSGAPFLPSFFD